MRLFPCDNALLIACTLSPGFATKNCSIGIDVPAVGPLSHDVPLELRRTPGTNTLRWSGEPLYRNGASRVTGLVASVVYGPPHGDAAGKHCAGAPTTPEKTWFQTPLLQPSSTLLRVTHCCCEPLITVPPSKRESAMKPP